MKFIVLALSIAALGFAQNSTSQGTAPATAPAPKAAPKAAAPAQKSSAQNKKPAQPAKTPADQKAQAQTQTQSIPAGAKLVEPNLYRYTDSSGKTWNYRQTPFGISKWEETSAPGSQSTSQPASQLNQAPSQLKGEPVQVTDLGDSFRFQKKTPFGGSTWVRKKSELTDEEKALVGSQQTSSDSNPTNVASRPAGNQ